MRHTALLIGIEYVCHVYYCTPITIACQVLWGTILAVKRFVIALALIVVATVIVNRQEKVPNPKAMQRPPNILKRSLVNPRRPKSR